MTEEDDSPARRDVLSALWGTRRRRVLVAVAGVVVVAAITTAVVVGSAAERPVPEGTLPVLADQYASSAPQPPGSSTPSRPSLPAAGDPQWTFTMPEGTDEHDLPDFALTDSGFVVQRDDEVLGLDRTGKKVWSFTPAAFGSTEKATVRVTATLVFVGFADPNQDRWPQPDVIVALDAATGAEVWRDTEASLWSVTTDTIYLSVCFGGQNNRLGDCTFSARDPRTRAVRWSVPTYASSRVVNDSGGLQAEATPPVLLIESYPRDGSTVDVAAHNSATGALRGRGFTDAEGDIPSIDVATANTVVTVDDEDDNPANGCTATLTGFSVAATQTWQYTARTTKTDDGKKCARLPVSYNGAKLGLTSAGGVPVVLNVDSGVVEWTAPANGTGLAAAGTTLLAVEPTADGVGELVAYQVGNPQPVWRVPFRGGLDRLDSWHVRITGTVAVFTSFAGEAVGYDLATGAGQWYGEAVEQDTGTWFAVCGGVTCKGYATA